MQLVHLYYNQTFCICRVVTSERKILCKLYMKIKPAQILKTAKMSLLVPAAR